MFIKELPSDSPWLNQQPQGWRKHRINLYSHPTLAIALCLEKFLYELYVTKYHIIILAPMHPPILFKREPDAVVTKG